MRTPGILSMESIAFINPVCYKELCLAFAKLGKGSKTNDFVDIGIDVEAIIKHHTNMTVKLVFDDIGVGAYMIVPEITNSHPLFNDGTYVLSNSDGLKMIRTAKKALNGWVDTKHGKVYGVFADIEITVHLPKSDFLTGFLTNEESTGVYLHECGHGFTYFEYLSRTSTTNQVLAGVSRCLDGSNNYETKETVLMEVAKSVGMDGVDVKTLAKSADKRVIDTVIINAMNQQYAKETGYDIYDRTSSESLADAYATRMGAGRALVTGLDKMYKKYGNMAYRTSMGYLLMESVKVSMLALSPYFVVAAPAGFTSLAVYLGIIGLFLILADATETGMAGRYDTPGVRFTRIRNQLVEKLKNQNLSKDEIAAIHGDITAIDQIAKDVHDRRQFFGVIEDFASSSKRFNRDMKLLQQSLEKLVANDLFVAAAKIHQTAA